MPGGQTPEPQNGSVRPSHGGGGPTHSQLPELPSMHVWPGGQGAVPHAPENEPIQVNGAVVVGQEVVVVVVFVGGHNPQSAGHVEQSSAGPHSPSPHVQLQRPSRHSDMTCLRHAALDLPLRPLAAISSPQTV